MPLKQKAMKKMMTFSKELSMYYVKKDNRKLTSKLFKTGFSTYEEARNAARRYLRSLGLSRQFSSNNVAIVKA